MPSFPSIVTLPHGCEPAFPQRCVACAADHPDDLIRAKDRSINWLFFMTIFQWFTGKKAVASAPSCYPCRLAHRRSVWGHEAVLWAAMITVVVLAIPWAKTLDVSRGMEKMIVIAVGLGAAVPVMMAMQFFFPLAFSVNSKHKDVDYEFRDPSYARDFYAENREQVTATDFQ